MRVVNILFAITVLAIVVWIAHSIDVKSRKGPADHTAVSSLQQTLPIGTSRADVEQYLESHSMKYSSTWESGRNSWTDVVQMENSDAKTNCGTQSLLVSLEFDPAGPSSSAKPPAPTDKLKKIVADSSGRC